MSRAGVRARFSSAASGSGGDGVAGRGSRGKPAGVGVGLAAVAVMAGAASVTSQAQAPPAEAKGFTVEFSQPKMTFIDEAPRGESVGDTAVDRYTLREIGGEGRTGFAVNHCVLTKRGKAPVGLCHGTLALGDGTITVQGISGNAAITRFAVTGGTERYAGATGEVASQRKGQVIEVSVALR